MPPAVDVTREFPDHTDGSIGFSMRPVGVARLYGLYEMEKKDLVELAANALKQAHWQKAHIKVLRSETVRIRR